MNHRTILLLPVLFVVFFASSVLFSPPAKAEPPMPVTACYSFDSNIRPGQQDAGSNSNVDSLQHFLSTKGDFDAALLGTGHFGPLTLKAVLKFQAANTVPATGFVGPLTRAAIAKAQPDCGSTVAAATLYSLSPVTGSTGTEMSIKGFGFSQSNTILVDGMVAARNVPIASSIAIACTTDPSCHGGINQTITFTLPDSVSPDCPVGSMCPLYMRLLSPGKVTISVRNSSAVSNGLPFTISK